MDQDTLNEVKEELAKDVEQQADEAGAIESADAAPAVAEKSTADAALEAFGLPAQAKPEDAKPADEAAANATDSTNPAQEAAPANDKKPDDLAELSPKAQNRFQELTATLKEKDAQLEQATQAISFIRDTIGDDPRAIENFKAFGAYQKAIATGDIQTAKSVLIGQLEQLAMVSGDSSITVDPLAAFPDLREKVDAFELDPNVAMELARSRTVQQQQLRHQELQQQTYQQQLDQQQATHQGMQSVAELCNHLLATDPDYLAKEKVLMEQVSAIRDNYPPSMWAAQLQLAYNVATQALKAQQQAAPRRTGNTLRSTGLSGQRQLPNDTAGQALALFPHLQ